jgi:hypothetical protein
VRGDQSPETPSSPNPMLAQANIAPSTNAAATILALQSSVGALNGEAPVSTPQR